MTYVFIFQQGPACILTIIIITITIISISFYTVISQLVRFVVRASNECIGVRRICSYSYTVC